MTDFSSAYREDIKPHTGGYLQVYEKLSPSLRAYVRRNAVENWFVGITSNGKEGLRARWNGKYKKRDFHKIIWLYSTGSQDFARRLETKLVQGFEHYTTIDNERGGGGGNNSRKPPYVVYCAYKSKQK
ncbi:hypothetical protein P9112_000827 [Eukaryota sp. TZLM1-RC]